MELHLDNKVALVLASSQGLGKAVATQLKKENAHVMLASRDLEKLKQTYSELETFGTGKIAYHVTDLSNNGDIQSLVKKTMEQFGKIDIVINNTGGPPSGTFEQLTDEHWQKSFELNLLSYIRVIREVLPYLKDNGGRIVNIASSSIKQPIPGLLLSNTFRLGIVGLTKTLAEELAPYQILINTVAPGRIATDRVAQLDQIKADQLGKTRSEIEQESQKSIPLQRYGTPEEFANVVTFLVSDACTYMTGSSFLVDGGMIKAI